jgi:Reverse transcriptase (RNA-dependent DNA polymerase)/gag-polypeptide of LTR copia-type
MNSTVISSNATNSLAQSSNLAVGPNVMLSSPVQFIKWKAVLTNRFKSKPIHRKIFMKTTVVVDPADESKATPVELEMLQAECEMIAELTRSVSDEYGLYIAGKTRFVEMWELLTKMMDGERSAKVEGLKFRIINLKYKKSINGFVSEFRTAVAEYQLYGGQMSENELAMFMLAALPREYSMLGAQLRREADSSKLDLKLETVYRALQIADAQFLSDARDTREESVPVKEEPVVMFNKDGSFVPKKRDISKLKCYCCGEKGHFARKCPKRVQSATAGADVGTNTKVTFMCIVSDQPARTYKEVLLGDKTRNDTTACDEFTAVQTASETVGLATSTGITQNSFVLDTGSTVHLCGDRAKFVEIKSCEVSVETALPGTQFKALEKGCVQFMLNTQLVELRDVLCVPGCVNVISVTKLIQSGCTLMFGRNQAVIQGPGRFQFTARLDKGLWIVDVDTAVALTTRVVSPSYALLHHRYGHASDQAIEGLIKLSDKHGLDSFAQVERQPLFCAGCNQGKMTKAEVSKLSHNQEHTVKDIGAKLYMDTVGPFSRAGHRHETGALIATDCVSRYHWVFPFVSKATVPGCVLSLCESIRSHTGSVPKYIHCDKGTEFNNREVLDYCTRHGIAVVMSPTNTPQLNGTAERANRTIVEMGRTMLYSAKLPVTFWVQALQYAVLLLNRLPIKRFAFKRSSYVRWFERYPDMSTLYIFGCGGYGVRFDPQATKLDSRAIPCKFLGYSDVTSEAVVLWLDTNRLGTTRSIKLDEQGFLMQAKIASLDIHSRIEEENVQVKNCEQSGNDQVFQAQEEINDSGDDFSEEETITIVDNGAIRKDLSDSSESRVRVGDSPAIAIPDKLSDSLSRVRVGDSSAIAIPDKLADSSSSKDYRSHRIGTRSRVNKKEIALEGQRLFSKEWTNLTKEMCLHMLQMNAPKSYNDIESFTDKVQWMESYHKEIKSLEEMGEFEVVPRPSGVQVLPILELMNYKRDAVANVIKRKTRIVVQGNRERDVDVEALYAPVASYESVRLFLALIANRGWKVRQLDVSNAFINGRREDPIYIELPVGHVQKLGRDLVWTTSAAVYGLRDAPKRWYSHLAERLLSRGLKPLVTEPCWFVDQSLTIMVVVYVDDLLYAASEDAILERFEQFMKGEFKLQVAQQLTEYVGFGVDYDKDRLKISAVSHIEELASKCGVEQSRAVSCPSVGEGVTVTASARAILGESADRYRSIVGALLYVSLLCRPDVTYVVAYLGRYLSKANSVCMDLAMRTVKYLYHTRGRGIVYQVLHTYAVEIVAYVDSDWGSSEDRKSTTGYVVYLNGSVLAFKSKKQNSIAMSSAEAEYCAVSKVIMYLRGLLNMMKELKLNVKQPVQIWNDNQAAISIMNSNVKINRTKHVELKYFYIRQELQKGDLKLSYIGTNENVADGMTKGLIGGRFIKFVDKIVV